jgi:hypothetical protein
VTLAGPIISAADLVGHAASEFLLREIAALRAFWIGALRPVHASAGRIAAVRRADIVVDAIDRCMATPHGRVAGVRRAGVVVIAQVLADALAVGAIIMGAGIVVIRTLRPPAADKLRDVWARLHVAIVIDRARVAVVACAVGPAAGRDRSCSVRSRIRTLRP